MKKITEISVRDFNRSLIENEKSESTICQYTRDVNAFVAFLNGDGLTKEKVTEYKKILIEKYAPASVNAAIASINSFLDFLGLHNMRLKSLKIQRKIFTDKEKELSKSEYTRLLYAAKKKSNKRIYYIMQTICATGIRVSELKFITYETLKKGIVQINCKGKLRVIIIPDKLCSELEKYAKIKKIKKGSIFVTRNGKPIDRSNIWHEMKKLCNEANVSSEKVFPHNLRHLFARTYYQAQKDIVKLADILGHSSINTTRIYTMESGEVHRMQIERLGLLLC